MSGPLTIENHGPLIIATNYFQLPPRPGELLLVSLNAGAFRVLLRREAEGVIPDMTTAKECVVSRGPWPTMVLVDAVEILFDDGSDSPFALHLQIESFDHLPTDANIGPEWTLSVWTDRRGSPRKVLERPAFYRRVPYIPWLKPRAG